MTQMELLKLGDSFVKIINICIQTSIVRGKKLLLHMSMFVLIFAIA